MKNTFGMRILEIYKAEGIRQVHFCQATGLPQSLVSGYTSGSRKPSLSSLQKIIKAYPNVDTHWLVTGERNE